MLDRAVSVVSAIIRVHTDLPTPRRDANGCWLVAIARLCSGRGWVEYVLWRQQQKQVPTQGFGFTLRVRFGEHVGWAAHGGCRQRYPPGAHASMSVRRDEGPHPRPRTTGSCKSFARQSGRSTFASTMEWTAPVRGPIRME